MRVKKGVQANKRRKNVLKLTKGYRHGRKSKEREAKVAISKALSYARAHRRDKKSDFRKLWNVKINAGARSHGLTYSRLIDDMKKKGIVVDRKILADLAENKPESFARVIANVKA